MGFKCVLIALALVVCLSSMTLGQGPKDYVVKPFPGENMSGSEIYREVRGGVYTDANDSALSFYNESLFLINPYTGMSPNAVGKGVRTPVKIFSIDVRTQGIHAVLTNSRPVGHKGWR
jgi:hypothetical protein